MAYVLQVDVTLRLVIAAPAQAYENEKRLVKKVRELNNEIVTNGTSPPRRAPTSLRQRL